MAGQVGGKTILIIDSDRMMLDLLTHEIASDSVWVSSATTITEGRVLLGQIHPDIVILDPEIPNGMEFLSEIRSANQPVAAIVLTHSDSLNERLAALAVESVIDRSHGLKPLLNSLRACLDLESEPADKVHILVVDDEPELRKTLSAFLGRLGYRVSTAADGDQALEMINRDTKLAIVLLDLNIAGKGGMEVLRAVRSRHATLGVIMLTGISDSEIAQQAMTLGAFDYILKPFDFRALESVISACLSHIEFQGRPWWKV